MAKIESLKKIFANWKYLGQVKSLRSRYYVFELGNDYAIVRPDNRFKRGYNIVLFDCETIENLRRLYQGRRSLTTAKILNDKEVKQLFPIRDQKTRQLLLLQALLILACKGDAHVRKRGRELVFTVAKIRED